ncbi:MAG TPA: DUF4291 domain-containing protein [Chitinophagaceae bacterium]|nr:DUF4291 domain-containing protein [Chitinophagaceae bacterium]
MKIKTEHYLEAVSRLPQAGQHILGYQENDQIVVYQAFNHQIADYAVKNQTFGGPHYSYSRMSWIKPNFLWMMYRCGWASKENQERILAIWLNKMDFENILRAAVFSSFNSIYYQSHDQWKEELNQKEVRLQWDPDHDPFGGKLTRRAIQIGMKGSVLETFGKHQIKMIEDISEFVKEQKVHVDNGKLDKLVVPIETVYSLADEDLRKRIGVDD